MSTHYVRTETAMMLTSLMRPEHDKAWNYLRPAAHAAPYIFMKALDGDTYELVALDGHKPKMVSNSMDPPNSYHSGDLFQPHPAIPDAWKFIGRLDDRITLINGEKVLPLSIEGYIRQHALVKEAVVFGIDKPVCGLLVFRASIDASHVLTDEEFLDQIWPAVDGANHQTEGFSQISREMIAVIPNGVECPLTDKGSIQRARVYERFADIISDKYKHLEGTGEGTLKLTVDEMRDWITKAIRNDLEIPIDGADADLFSAGLDSLKEIQLKGLILKHLDVGTGSANMSPMFVLEYGNVDRLAQALLTMRTGSGPTRPDEQEQMAKAIKTYSLVPEGQVGGTKVSERKLVVSGHPITGFTTINRHSFSQELREPLALKSYAASSTIQLSFEYGVISVPPA